MAEERVLAELVLLPAETEPDRTGDRLGEGADSGLTSRPTGSISSAAVDTPASTSFDDPGIDAEAMREPMPLQWQRCGMATVSAW